MERQWALSWQQVALEWVYAVVRVARFGNCGSRCCYQWNDLIDTDLLISREKVLCQWLHSWALFRQRSIWWSGWRCPCSWRVGWTRWPLKAPSNRKHSMILWSSCTKRKREVISVQAISLQWNSFIPWLKTLGPLRSFPVWSLKCGEIVEQVSSMTHLHWLVGPATPNLRAIKTGKKYFGSFMQAISEPDAVFTM